MDKREIIDAYERFMFYRSKYDGTYLYPNFWKDLDIILYITGNYVDKIKEQDNEQH